MWLCCVLLSSTSEFRLLKLTALLSRYGFVVVLLLVPFSVRGQRRLKVAGLNTIHNVLGVFWDTLEEWDVSC
jgi:hypothetical protein